MGLLSSCVPHPDPGKTPNYIYFIYKIMRNWQESLFVQKYENSSIFLRLLPISPVVSGVSRGCRLYSWVRGRGVALFSELHCTQYTWNIHCIVRGGCRTVCTHRTLLGVTNVYMPNSLRRIFDIRTRVITRKEKDGERFTEKPLCRDLFIHF